MGNVEVKSFLNSVEDSSSYLSQFMNLEVLSHGQFLADRWVSFNIEKNKDYQNYFDWSNVQKVAHPDQIEENIRLHDSKENLLVGRLPPMISPDLLNPSFFDDVQLPFSPSDVVDFKELQNKKFLILYKFFYTMQKLRKQDQNPISSIQNTFKSGLPKAAEVGIRSGVHLLISLLREAAKNNQQLSDDTLNFLLELFIDVKPLSLWGTQQIDIVLDKSLHTVADYLEELISSEKTSPLSKRKALKVLFSLGLLRGSLPNLLSVVALLRKYHIDVDLTRELKLLQLEKSTTQFKFEKKLKAYTKLFFTSASEDVQAEKSPYVSITTDGKYIYLHSELEGLLKIGTGYGYTMFGKVYKHVKEYRIKEKGTLAFVLGKLYYRSARISPAPIIELDTDTLEETGIPIHYDTFAPNSIFGELTNPEIEFPIQSSQEQESRGIQELKSPEKVLPSAKSIGGSNEASQNAANQNRSAAANKRDLRLMRPAQRSPMFTDGRYIYIVSQWTVDSRAGRSGGGGDSDDEDEGENVETKQARYGVDIYDPILDFEHVRAVELFDPNLVESKESSKSRQKAALTTKALEQAIFTTNGSELLVGCPPGTDDSSETRYKYFNLADGKLRAVNPVKDPSHFYNVTYDSYNNVVYSLNDNKKSFDILSCLKNDSVAEPVCFPEESDLFVPFENSQIIELASEEVGLADGGEDMHKKEKEEKRKEELQLLMSVGFHDDTNKGLNEVKLESNESSVTKSTATQLFILANIARLAEGYATLNQDSGADVASNIRKPYSVHLINKVFRNLEEFIETYSNNFFEASEEQITDEFLFDQCSFLCTMRILKYNLAALETYSESLKSIGLKVINDDFPTKLQKFMWRIFEMKPSENSDLEDLRKALYQEALSILQYALSIIYPDIGSVLILVKNYIKDLNNPLNRDISNAILFWLKSKDHVVKLVAHILQSTEHTALIIRDVKDLIGEVISWEVKQFSQYLKGCQEWEKLPTYESVELITTSMSFAIEFQKEIQYQLGVKIQDKNLEHSMIHQSMSDFTEVLCKNGVLINFELQATLSRLGPKIQEYFENEEKSGKIDDDTNEKKIPTALLKYKNKLKKKKSKEMLILEAYQDTWEHICNVYVEKVYFSQLVMYQFNALSLLSSNFLIASKTLKSISGFLNSLNALYETRKIYDRETNEGLATSVMERQVIFECAHPPPKDSSKKEKISIPGAKELKIVFDPLCDLRQHHDWLQFFKDDQCRQLITQRLDRPGTWPKTELIIKGDFFWYNFQKNNFGDSQNWGYKFTVSASFKETQEGDWLTSLHRSTCWLAGKCAGQLINGSALQQAMLQDEEQKYNSLLNSKLFSGGMEKCYFSGGKEGVWTQLSDIIDEFQAGHLSEYLVGEISEVEKIEEEFLKDIIYSGRDTQMDKTVEFIQKQFSKEALWANLGGENGSKCVRAAYAVIIKHSGLINELKDAMLEVEIGDDKGKVPPNIKNLVKKWGAASRMRSWLVERRKDIDDREEKLKQMTQATQKQQTTKSAVPKKSKFTKRKEAKGRKTQAKTKETGAQKEETKEEMIPMEEHKDGDPISQGGMQVRDTEEIIHRMIDQIVKKAEFLCQLIPSKHWSGDPSEKREKQLLFRTTSKKDEEVNKEEEWKRRLNQWKSVRQAKQVYKSLEDESQEIHASLNSSVILCLQSAVSIKRLRKQVESSYLRAICRTIGLNALTLILTGVKSSLFKQDVVGWLCTSLRGNENKLYHFTDNLQGCGHYLESTVNTAFKNVIVAIIKSMSKSDQPEEVNCMLEALKWKYHGDDHVFLAEIDLFGILRGQEDKQLLRKAWGQSIDPQLPGRVESKLVKNLVTLFETVLILCVGKLNWTLPEQKLSNKKDKLPSLERHVSSVDEYSVEILIKQAFHVLFAELEEANINYSKYNGINWRIYNRVKAVSEYQQTKADARKLKTEKMKSNQPLPRGGRRYQEHDDDDYDDGDDGEGNFGRNQVRNAAQEPKKKAKETFSDEELDQEEEQFLKEMQEEEKSGIEPEEESKHGEKGNKKEQASKKVDDKAGEEADDEDEERAARKQKRRLLNSLAENEKRVLREMQQRLYNPDFLYRLLALIYKCVTMGSDNVSVVIGNPKYLSILFSLIKHSPSSHQILITKTLQSLFLTLPHELFIDSIQNLQKLNPIGDGYLKYHEKEEESTKVLKYFLNILIETRSKIYVNAHESQGSFSVSCETTALIRHLLANPNWARYVEAWLTESINSSDVLLKQTAFAILGGDLNGLRIGGKIAISTNNRDEIFADNILLKQDLHTSPDYATIVGFTTEYVEKINEEEAKKREKAKPAEREKWKIRMDIGSAYSNLNPLVLIHSTISKEIPSFSTVELATVNRFNSVSIDTTPFQPESYEFSKHNSVLLPVYKWAIGNDIPKDTNNLYLRTLAIKSLDMYARSQENSFLITSKHKDLIESLLNLATKSVVSSQLMNLEITEEKLFRLLQLSCEKNVTLSELPPLCVTLKNKEIEILLGKDLTAARFSIQAGFNLQSVKTYLELIQIENPAEFVKRKDLKEYLSERAVLLDGQYVQNFPDITLHAQLIITCNYDLQKFSEYYDQVFTQSGKKSEESKQREEDTMILSEGEALPTKETIKLPKCIVLVSDRTFYGLNKELIQQKNKEFKEVFENKDLLTELVEYGFPRDIVEKYLQENPSGPFDVVINDIVKLIEQVEVAKKNQNKKRGVGADGKGPGLRSAMMQMAQMRSAAGFGMNNIGMGQPNIFNNPSAQQISKGPRVSKNSAESEEESKEGLSKKPEDPETEIEKEKAKKMKMLQGGLDEEANPALKKIKEQSIEPIIGAGNVPQLDSQHEETKLEVSKGDQKSKETKPIESEEQVIFDSEEEDELYGPQDEIDIEKEDPNPCFKCQGEKELQHACEQRNRRYDDLLAFESLNQIGKIILFKQLNYSLSIFYARRILLQLIEKWSDDNPIFFITDSKYHNQFIAFLKLLSNEAMLSSGTFCNNNLIMSIRKILESLFTKEAHNPNLTQFINILFNESVVKPLEDIEKNYLIKPKSKIEMMEVKINSKKKGKNNKKGSNRRVYSGKEVLEFQIDRASLEHSLIIAHVFLNSEKEAASKRVFRFDILFQLFGIIPIIRSNRSLLWGAQIFALNMIDKFITNLPLVDFKLPTNDPNLLLYHQHVVNLHEFFSKLKQREKQDSYSRRTQIISEILINLNRFRTAIAKSTTESVLPIGSAGGKIDVIKYKNIENLADVVDIMQTYPEHKSLLAATWLQVSNDLIKNEQKVTDGDHFYYKNLHSYKVVVPYASEVTVKFSEDCQTDAGDSIMFSSDPNGELSAEKVSGTIAKKTVTYSAGTFYLHFPTKGADVVAFGQNDTYNFHHEVSNNGPVCLEEFNCWNTQFIDGSDTHTWILNKQGEIWNCGSGSHTGLSGTNSSKVFTLIKTKDRVKLISCGSNHSIFITESNQVYGLGSNQDGKLGLQWNQGGGNPVLIDIGKKVIKEISCGVNHTMMCSVDGQLFGAGSNEFGQLGIQDETGNKVHAQNTFRHINIKESKVIRVSAGLGFTLIIARQRGKNVVQAAGDKSNGKLGLGDDSLNAGVFTTIPALEAANIVSIHTKRRHSVVVSHSGRVYSWGMNDQGQLGHGDFESRSTPKLIEFFKDMKVISAGVGGSSTIIVASSKSNENANVFAFGNSIHNKLGIKGKEKITRPTQIEFFEDKRPSKVFCATNHTFVITDPMQIHKIRETHHFPCHLSGSKTIEGAMIVDVLDKNQTYSAIEFEKAALKSPLTILVREAIKSKEINWPDFTSFKADEFLDDVNPGPNVDFKLTCSATGTPITGVCYVNLHLDPNEPQEYLSQEAAHSIPVNQVSPTLYYRITRPLKAGKSLPVLPKTHFFAQSETYGYNITITPHYNEKGHDYMMNKYSESFEAFSADMKNLKPEVDEQLVDMINYLAQKLEKNVFELSENITFPKEEVSLRNAIEKASNDFLKKRFLILKALNTKFKSLLPYIDFSAKKESTRLRNIYSNASVFIFWDVKSELFDKLLAQDAKPSANPKIKVNRMRASKFIGKGKPDHTGEFTVFGQIYQYFKTAGFGCFKVGKDQNPFNVGFIGEASIDAGGPYREAVSQMCTELQSGALPLLIPSPNQKNDSGQFREKWVLNPSANSLIHTKMYEFLGALMGCSIRSKNFLNLDLPSMVWKLLVDVPVYRKDLEHIDRYLIQCLDDVINIHKKGVDENSFSEIIQEKFVTTLSDGSEVELVPGGVRTIVTFDTRVEWAGLVEKIRLNESKKQAEAIRRGLMLIIPEGVLNLLTWRELETLVCGKPILDVDLLKTNTIYRSCSETDQIIEFFWRAIVEFTPEERSMYLRFVWGRSRLPLTSKDFPMKHIVEILRTQNDPDLMLPVAHTCFFQLDIPKYSSYEVCRDKLRYAITHCQAIDTDGRAYDIWEEED